MRQRSKDLSKESSKEGSREFGTMSSSVASLPAFFCLKQQNVLYVRRFLPKRRWSSLSRNYGQVATTPRFSTSFVCEEENEGTFETSTELFSFLESS